MAAPCNRAGHYIFALWFLLLSSFFLLFSSCNLSRRRLDVYRTSKHGVALVRIQDAGLKRAARGSLKNTGCKNSPKSPSGHHRTTLSGYIFATKARIENRKKYLLSSNISSTCPHNMVNFGPGPLAAKICWRVWGTPANCNGFRVLTALLHGAVVWASAKLCDVEQRAPPIFGRTAVTLGAGPHFWFVFILCCCIFFLISEYVLFVVLDLVFPYQDKRLAWGTSPK